MDPPWGVWGSSHTLGMSALGSDTRKTSPLVGLKTRGAYERALRNSESVPGECAHSLAYSWEHCGGYRLKTAWYSGLLARTTQYALQPTLGSCSCISSLALIPTKVEAAIAKESVHTWREQNWFGPWPCLWPGQRQILPEQESMYRLGREWNQLQGRGCHCRCVHLCADLRTCGNSWVVWLQLLQSWPSL